MSLEQIYKKHVVTSKGTRDPRKKLFRVRIQIVIEYQGTWSFKGTWQPLEARFQTKQDAEAFGIAWAKGWIDQQPWPPLPPAIPDEIQEGIQLKNRDPSR